MKEITEPYKGWTCRSCNAPVAGPHAECPNCLDKPPRAKTHGPHKKPQISGAQTNAPPEDPTYKMLNRGQKVAQRTGTYLNHVQIHDIWQSMYDEWRDENEKGKL